MNKTTNTNGIISAAAAEKTVEKKKATPAQILNNLLDNNRIQSQINEATKGNAGAFTASLLNLFNNDSKLQLCDPKAVYTEALKAAVLGLPIEKSLQFAFVVPYYANGKYVPQFQLGYRGMIQLCLRTKAYKYINADAVYKGEYKGADKLTGHVDLNGEKISDEIIGYFAYIETVDGFKKAEYWDKEKVRKHATRYSKSKNPKNGELVGAWKSNFDEMAIKTVLRNLLSKYGVMSVDMVNAISVDEPVEPTPEAADIEIEATADDVTIPSSEIPGSLENSEDVPLPVEISLEPDEYPFAE